MPAQANGSGKTGVLEMKDGETFLFTSESVGEGHPGLYIFCPLTKQVLFEQVHFLRLLFSYSRQVHQ